MKVLDRIFSLSNYGFFPPPSFHINILHLWIKMCIKHMECAGAPNTGKTWSCWRDEHTKTSSKNHPESLHHPTHPGFGFICLFMGVLKHCREFKTAQGLKPSGTVCAPSEIKWLQGLGDDFFFC